MSDIRPAGTTGCRATGCRRVRPTVCAVIFTLALACAAAAPNALAQYPGAHLWRSHLWMNHYQFGIAHTLMTDRVAFDEQGYIDLQNSSLHPMAIRDLFPYPWLYRSEQISAMGYNPILFWSIPYYLPSYDELRRIYTLGGYFFDPWFNFHGGFWERAWIGSFGVFPYDYYYWWWSWQFYSMDYPYGAWWRTGSTTMDRMAAAMIKADGDVGGAGKGKGKGNNPLATKKRGSWPDGPWVREPYPTMAFFQQSIDSSVLHETVASGRWPDLDEMSDLQIMLAKMAGRWVGGSEGGGRPPEARPLAAGGTRIAGENSAPTAPRGFLPEPGPERIERSPYPSAAPSAPAGQGSQQAKSERKRKKKQ